jgi:hypothetical protein
MESEVRQVKTCLFQTQESARVARDCVETAHEKNKHFAGVILQAAEKIEAIRDEAGHASVTALGAAEKAGNIAGELFPGLLETMRQYRDNGKNRVVQDPACPPETFTVEQIREAIRRARIIRVK